MLYKNDPISNIGDHTGKVSSFQGYCLGPSGEQKPQIAGSLVQIARFDTVATWIQRAGNSHRV